jgi:hypothetical protein
MSYIQIFVYNTPGINAENNFPILSFRSEDDMVDFIDKLSDSETTQDKPYFVINNPHMLPIAALKDRARRAMYPIDENKELLKTVTIHNNSIRHDDGFTQALMKF